MRRRPLRFGAAVFVCAAACALDPADADVDRFALQWSLAQGTAAVSCAEAGAARVVAVTELDAGDAGIQMFEDAFDCAAGAGQTRALPTGELRVRLEARDAGGAVLGASAPQTQQTRGNGGTFALEPFTIDVGAQ